MNKIAFIITIVTLTLISALHAQMQIKSSDGSTLATMNASFGYQGIQNVDIMDTSLCYLYESNYLTLDVW